MIKLEKKTQYTAPKLIIYGSVAKLTASGTGTQKENGVNRIGNTFFP